MLSDNQIYSTGLAHAVDALNAVTRPQSLADEAHRQLLLQLEMNLWRAGDKRVGERSGPYAIGLIDVSEEAIPCEALLLNGSATPPDGIRFSDPNGTVLAGIDCLRASEQYSWVPIPTRHCEFVQTTLLERGETRGETWIQCPSEGMGLTHVSLIWSRRSR